MTKSDHRDSRRSASPEQEPAHPSAARHGGVAFWPAVIAAGLIAAVVHLPSLRNEFTNWDDTPYISNNPHLRSVEGLKRIWLTTESPQYYPLTFTSFWIEYQLWGEAPLGYHAVNVGLHALNAMLVVGLLRVLGMHVGAAFAVAVLFAVSPIQVMSVAWIAQRKNTLSMVFGLLAMLAAARYFERERIGWYVVSLVAFAAALLSKATWVVLPLVIALTAVWLQGVRWRRVVIPILPLVALSVLSVVITSAMERQYAEPDDLTLLERLPIAPGALMWYYGKTLIPVGLAPFYPTWPAGWLDWQTWFAIVLLATAVIVLCVAHRSMPRVVLWGIVTFAIHLLPITGIVSFGNIALTWVSDHYVYSAAVSLYAALVAAVGGVLRLIPARVKPVAVGLLLVPTAAAMAYGTILYTPVFRDGLTFWQRTIEVNPRQEIAYQGRAYAHVAARRYDLAIADLQRAVELNPRRYPMRVDLGWVYNQVGRHEDAIRVLREVLKEDASNAKAMVLLADALLADARDPAEAETMYLEALRVAPGYDEAANNLALLYAQMRRTEDAERIVRQALEVNPQSAQLWRALGQHCDRLGATADAESAFRQSISLQPEDADSRFGLGVTLFRQRRFDEAIEQYERAIAIFPRAARYWNNLGCAHLDAGRPEIAAEKIRRAVEIDPFDAPAWNNLGAALDRMARREEALAAYRKAVEIDPTYWRAAQRMVAVLMQLGRYREAADQLNQTISGIAQPEARRALSLQMAMLSAAAPDEAVRRPDFALQLVRAVQQSLPAETADLLDVLGMALAANGEFESAAEAGRKAAERFESEGRTAEAAAARARAAKYELREAYRLHPAN